MTTTMISMVVMVMVGVTQLESVDATVNITAGLAAMRAEWFNPKYRKHSLEPDERYYFEQVYRRWCSVSRWFTL